MEHCLCSIVELRFFSPGGYMYCTYNSVATRGSFSPQTNGIVSDLTEGASGGPWIAKAQFGNNDVLQNNIANGVNSYYIPGLPYMYVWSLIYLSSRW